MSFRSSEGSQHRDAEAAVAKPAVKMVLDANGDYELTTEGSADAVLIDSTGDYLVSSTGTAVAHFIQRGTDIFLLAK